jgi:hypothetical protein
VKKRKEDFMILIAETFNMDEEVKAAHMFFREAILQEMGIRKAATTPSTATTAESQTTAPEDQGAAQLQWI